MADALDRFTLGARRALSLASEAAQQHGQPEITSGYQLLGAVQAVQPWRGYEAKVALDLLFHIGFFPSRVLESALTAELPDADEPLAGEPALSDEAKAVLQHAVDEARQLGDDHIGIEHLILGVLSVPAGLGCRVLNRLGLDLEGGRAALACVLHGPERAKMPGAYRRGDPSSLRGTVWSRETPVKRYNLALPESLYDDVVAYARKEQTTVVDALRRFIKLGLLAANAVEVGGALVLRDAGGEREIMLL